MKRFMLALVALAALGVSTSIASADVTSSDKSPFQTAVLHQGNDAQVDQVRWGHRAGWGWGGWYGSGYWPSYGYYQPYYGSYYSSYPYTSFYGGYSYPYSSFSSYPYWGGYSSGCCGCY